MGSAVGDGGTAVAGSGCPVAATVAGMVVSTKTSAVLTGVLVTAAGVSAPPQPASHTANSSNHRAMLVILICQTPSSWKTRRAMVRAELAVGQPE